jgi:cobalt-zinc-cadmium efflux system outer membrane protein
VALEEARRIPNVTANGGARRHNETEDTALIMQLSLPIPVFDRNQGALLAARYQLAKAGEDRRTAEARVLSELASTYAELSSAFAEAIALQTDVVPGAQRAFEAFREGYRQGKFGLLEVLDAQRTLFEAKGRYLEALTAYHQAGADMERLIGAPLETVTGAPVQP